MHNDDFASSDHYRVGNSKLHTANAISLQNSQSVEQQPIKYIGQEFGESLNTLTLLNQEIHFASEIEKLYFGSNSKWYHRSILYQILFWFKFYARSDIQFASSSKLSQKSILDQKPSPR